MNRIGIEPLPLASNMALAMREALAHIESGSHQAAANVLRRWVGEAHAGVVHCSADSAGQALGPRAREIGKAILNASPLECDRSHEIALGIAVAQVLRLESDSAALPEPQRSALLHAVSSLSDFGVRLQLADPAADISGSALPEGVH